MSRDELKEIVIRIIERVIDEQSPGAACIFSDTPCDGVTTYYGVGEEDMTPG